MKPTFAVRDLAGQRFGMLTVECIVDGARIRKSSVWVCRCDCGGSKITTNQSLTAGYVKSCGCQRTKHGQCGNPTWQAWQDMKRRCYSPNRTYFENYGGRGIEVCARWRESFQNFFEDMGTKPEGMMIERKDNDGNYDPDNCKWANRIEQNNNTRRNHFLEIDGRRLTISQWSREPGVKISRRTIHHRLIVGLNPKAAVFGEIK